MLDFYVQVETRNNTTASSNGITNRHLELENAVKAVYFKKLTKLSEPIVENFLQEIASFFLETKDDLSLFRLLQNATKIVCCLYNPNFFSLQISGF